MDCIRDAANSMAHDFCCYTPSAAPPNYTCLQDQLVNATTPVPGCQPGVSFGFACTGQQGSFDIPHEILRMACAVERRRFPVGASPTRQPLQPEATGAVMEVTKWLKPSV